MRDTFSIALFQKISIFIAHSLHFFSSFSDTTYLGSSKELDSVARRIGYSKLSTQTV